MPTFQRADQSAFDLCESIVSETYPDLAEAGVTFGLIFAYPKEGIGPALKHHGYPAAAIIKITSKEARTAARLKGPGLPDVVIKIDGNRWEEFDEERRAALLDHELRHLTLKRDKEGVVEEDDQDRPKLKLCLHDAEVGIFYDVIARHGSASIDAQVCQDLYRNLVQREFDFGHTNEDEEATFTGGHRVVG